jgi:hydrogenase nickel incorporation protein HypA/HybF
VHEMSLATGVVQIVEDAARAHGARAVRVVRLEIGQLAAVEVEALRFCFEAVARGTVAEAAVLEIVTTPGTAWCMPCGGSVELVALGQPCPACGSFQLQVTSGTEMRVRDLEID